MTKDNKSKILDVDDVICRNRIYECLGCGFVGREGESEEHQIKCENPMRLTKYE